MGTSLSRALPWLPYVSLVGLLVLIVNLAFSFEEPHEALVVAAAVLLMAAPLGMALHLGTTRELTPVEKRLWLAGLASWSAPSLFAAYFGGRTRGAATRKLSRTATA